jgi:type IV pilus assembly protein PilW
MQIMVLGSSNLTRLRNGGVTLIELMIAMAIGLLIIAGIGYIYLQGREGFRAQDNASRLRDEVRFAVDTMSRDIRMARYMGCPKVVDSKPAGAGIREKNSVNFQLSAVHPFFGSVGGADSKNWLMKSGDDDVGGMAISIAYLLRGFDGGVGMPVNASITNRLEPNTGSIMLMRIGEEARHVDGLAKDDDTIRLATGVDTIPGYRGVDGAVGVVALSSCGGGVEILKATVGSAGRAFRIDAALNGRARWNNTGRVNTTVTPDAIIARFEPVMYYVSKASQNPSTGLPSLYRVSIDEKNRAVATNGLWDPNGGVLVAAGVENLQFRYQYNGAWYTATQVDALRDDKGNVSPNFFWPRVSAVEVTMTVISQDEKARTQSEATTTQSNTITDQRLREEVRFTVEVPNV